MIKVVFQIFCSLTDAWFFPSLKPFVPLPMPNNNYVFVSFCKKKAWKRKEAHACWCKAQDCHPLGNHARAEPLIGNPKGYPDHLCAAKLVKTEGFKSILLAQPSGDDLVLCTSMVSLACLRKVPRKARNFFL